MLLRMLSYSYYSKSEATKRLTTDNNHRYYGIYIPLRLELLREIDPALSNEMQRERFQFIFNCVSISSFIRELDAILVDLYESKTAYLVKIRSIIDQLVYSWDLPHAADCATLEELSFCIESTSIRIRSDWSKLYVEAGALKMGLLEPLISILGFVGSLIDQPDKDYSWVACFDEAEYLPLQFQSIFNTLMRSESGGIVIKMATLPMHWKTYETVIHGVFVQAGGDDFVFVNIDYAWDSEEFRSLTNSVLINRLWKTRIFSDNDLVGDDQLADFLGQSSDRDLVDIYVLTTKKESQKISDEVIAELWTRPKKSSSSLPGVGQVKRYAPIFLLREIYKLTKEGNRKIPRLAGARMARRLTGGNIRRFIQLCDLYYEASRSRLLTPNVQHEAAMHFSTQVCDRSNSVYREGFLLKEILERLGNYLHYQFHGEYLRDIGLDIELCEDILNQPRMIEAFESGVAYGYFICSQKSLFDGLSSGDTLRLANIYGAVKWLPMRGGDGTLLSLKSGAGQAILGQTEITEIDAKELTQQMQLEFTEEFNDEKI